MGDNEERRMSLLNHWGKVFMPGDCHGFQSHHRGFSSLYFLPRVHATAAVSSESVVPLKIPLKRTGTSIHVISEVEVNEFLTKETGRDRLVRMFSKDYRQHYSDELMFIYHTMIQTTVLTFAITTYFGAHHSKKNFIEKNFASTFRTRFQASRLMHDNLILGSMRDGAKWAFRVGTFSGIFLFLSQSMAVYRNKSSVWEYVFASAVTSSFLKMNMGLRGMVGGAFFGSAMGLMGGLLIYGCQCLLGETQEERHHWQIQKLLEVEREMKGYSNKQPVKSASD